MDFESQGLEELTTDRPEDAFPFKDSPTVSWIDVVGLHRTEALEAIGRAFGIHPLVLEDIANVHQRPKGEYYDEYIFVALKMLRYEQGLKAQHISLVLGRNFLLTFQEGEGDVFDPVRERIRKNRGQVRKKGADYLLYCLLDVVVDHYFLVLEGIGEEIELLEGEVLENPSSATVRALHRVRRDLIELRKAVWPPREVVNALHRESHDLIEKDTLLYLRDLYDHTIQVLETVESLREMVTGVLDVYLSSMSQRTNEIMKVLTIIATIFIPLTFIVGIYGMNFQYMPELNWRFGYFGVLGLMGLVAGLMVLYFRRKKWL